MQFVSVDAYPERRTPGVCCERNGFRPLCRSCVWPHRTHRSWGTVLAVVVSRFSCMDPSVCAPYGIVGKMQVVRQRTATIHDEESRSARSQGQRTRALILLRGRDRGVRLLRSSVREVPEGVSLHIVRCFRRPGSRRRRG